MAEARRSEQTFLAQSILEPIVSWTSATQCLFSCGPGDGEKLFDEYHCKAPVSGVCHRSESCSKLSQQDSLRIFTGSCDYFSEVSEYFGKVSEYFQEVREFWGGSLCMFSLGNSFPELRNNLREIWGHFGKRGFRMILTF